jgi:hypothetical protein
MRIETKEALEFFVEKNERLKSLNLIKKPKQLGFRLSGDQNGTYFESTRPDDNDVQAYILTFRFFIDKKEHCSLQWLASNVLDDPELSDEWKEKFRATREELNKYLDQLPAMRLLKDNEKPLTRREIMNLFLFGDLSHATWNPENRRKFKDWTTENWGKELLATQFVEILLFGFRAIQCVANESKLELEKYDAG